MKRLYPAILAALIWLTLIVDYALVLPHPITPAGVFTTAAVLLSFFTILTNILIAAVLTAHALRDDSAPATFLTSPRTAAAVATYILLVCIIYNLLIRGSWSPVGLEYVTDLLFHDIIPLLYLIHWFRFVPKGRLRWRDGFLWLIYPLAFTLYNAFYNHFTGVNPYPFLNYARIGLTPMLANVAILTLTFLITGKLIIALDRFLHRRTLSRQPI